MECFIYWTADLKSSKLWSSQLWTQFKQFRIEAWKSQDFNGVWTRDLAIPVRRSNQLSYEAICMKWTKIKTNFYSICTEQTYVSIDAHKGPPGLKNSFTYADVLIKRENYATAFCIAVKICCAGIWQNQLVICGALKGKLLNFSHSFQCYWKI